MKQFLYLFSPLIFIFVAIALVALFTIWWLFKFKKVRPYFQTFTGLSKLGKILLSVVASSVVSGGFLSMLFIVQPNRSSVVGGLIDSYFQTSLQFLSSTFSQLGFEEWGFPFYIIPLVFYLFITFLPFTIVVGSVLLLLVRGKKLHEKFAFFLQFLLLTFFNTLAVAFVFLGFAYPSMRTIAICRDQIWPAMHQFRLHVDDLCQQRPDDSECPRIETDIRSFNPTTYDAIEQCTDIVYWYHPDMGHFMAERYSLGRYLVYSRDPRYPAQDFYTSSEINKLKKQYGNYYDQK